MTKTEKLKSVMRPMGEPLRPFLKDNLTRELSTARVPIKNQTDKGAVESIHSVWGGCVRVCLCTRDVKKSTPARTSLSLLFEENKRECMSVCLVSLGM